MVTQTTTSYNVSEVGPLTWYEPAACGGSSRTRNWTKKTYYSLSNDVDSRPKPQGPLYMYMTAQPKQEELVRLIGSPLDLVKSTLLKDCPGPTLRKYIVRSWPLPSLSLGQTAPPFPNTDLALRLRIKERSVNLGETLVEYRQTADMFHDFAKTVHTAVRDARRGNLSGLSEIIRNKTPLCHFAQAELMGSYGIAPLMGTVFGSALALKDALERGVVRKVTAQVSDKFKGSMDRTCSNGGCPRREWKGKASTRSSAWIRLHTPDAKFAFGNPAELAWEVVPFSFVVDWGIDVGSWLSSLDALTNVSAIWRADTKKLEWTQKEWWDGYDAIKGIIEQDEPGITKYRSHTRDVSTSIPIPPLPTWKPSMGYRRVIHAISLLTSLNCKSKDGSKPFRPR